MNPKDVLAILKKNNLCVLSTATSNGKSESAIMAFSVQDNLTLLFNTRPSTRKYRNILENHQVSVVVGGFNRDPFVQIDGTARILERMDADIAHAFSLKQHPELNDYLTSDGRWIEVKPTWLRYSDFSFDPPKMIETKI